LNFSYLITFAPLLTVAAGIALYQTCLKRIPSADFPFQLLAIVYTISAALTLGLSRLFPSKYDPAQHLREGGVNLLLLSAAPVVIEIGYLWAFKSGWKLSMLNGTVSAFCFCAMLAVGYVTFRERVTGTQWLAVACFVAGFVFSAK
jgi:drug/metabolite transporter (DMT)-like permease